MNDKEKQVIETSIDNENKRIADVKDRIMKAEKYKQSLIDEYEEKLSIVNVKIATMNASIEKGEVYINMQRKRLANDETE